MRTIEETLNDAKSLVDKIYENMSTVQTCEAIRDKIKTMRICYTGDENQILVLDKVLDNEQMNLTSEFITKMIDNRRNEAAKYLDFLNGKVPAIPNLVFEEAVMEMVQPKENPVIPDKIKDSSEKVVEKVLNKDEVVKMIQAGKKVKDIAEYYGKAPGRISQFMHDNGIQKSRVLSGQGAKSTVLPSGGLNIEFMEKKIGEIKALYTNGPFTLKKLADEYSCDQKELHKFLAERNLLKPRKNDPFAGK